MEPNTILTRSIEIRNPFELLSLPPVSEVYKKGYDGRLLGKTDTITQITQQLMTGKDWPRPLWKLASHLMMRNIIFADQKGYVCLKLEDGRQGRTFSFDATNTQSNHYWGFDRFKPFGYEPEVAALMDLLIKPHDTVIDAGANSGYFPLYILSNPVFMGRIHAFEPLQKPRKEMASILKMTGLENRVVIHAEALWNCLEMGAMKIEDKLHTGLATVYPEPQGKVALTTLDFMNMLMPDFIKIDIEGSESHMLYGAQKTLGIHRPIVVMESYIDPALGPVARKSVLDKTSIEEVDPCQFLQNKEYNLYQPCWLTTGGTLQPVPEKGTMHQELVLIPFDAEKRKEGPAKINILAVPKERERVLTKQFATRPCDQQSGAPMILPLAL